MARPCIVSTQLFLSGACLLSDNPARREERNLFAWPARGVDSISSAGAGNSARSARPVQNSLDWNENTGMRFTGIDPRTRYRANVFSQRFDRGDILQKFCRQIVALHQVFGVVVGNPHFALVVFFSPALGNRGHLMRTAQVTIARSGESIAVTFPTIDNSRRYRNVGYGAVGAMPGMEWRLPR
jgi:hypothetical protein